MSVNTLTHSSELVTVEEYLESELRAETKHEQTSPEAIVERLIAGTWKSEKSTGFEAILSLPEIGLHLPLAELYERLRF